MRASVEFRPAYATLTAELEPGESIKAEPGAMVAQAGVEMRTGMSAGLFGGLRRKIAGESFFVNTFTAQASGGWVSLASPAPGDLMEFPLEPGGGDLMVQGSSFLAGAGDVDIDSKFQGFRGMFTGESAFFLRISASHSPGLVWCNAFGGIKEVNVTPGDELVVDTGHLVAFTDGVSYSVGKVGGLKSLVAGGEGLVMKFRGQGRVWIQTRSLEALAEIMLPFFPLKD